jgi:hypothetical protein
MTSSDDQDRINARPVTSRPAPDNGQKLLRRECVILGAMVLLMLAVWGWMLSY